MKKKKSGKGRDKRDRRKRRKAEIPPFLTASILHHERRGGKGRRMQDLA